MVRGFWDNLAKPIIGLAPMDGVTDAAYRYLFNKYSKPHVTLTEFTNVEGLARGATSMLIAFKYDEIERPIVGQIYGVEPESFYKVSMILCFLGFDGIDVNMGCPANKVARRGSGAGLIKLPDLAKRIVRQCQQAAQDWANGKQLDEIGLPPKVVREAMKMKGMSVELAPDGSIIRTDEIRAYEARPRTVLPVSVKTRIGVDSIVAEDWMKHLLEVEPANISLHGRTLKQMYMGEANWEVIAKAAAVVHSSGLPTTILGNGDIKSMADALDRIARYGVDGVLVGRATFGNPWFFKGTEVGATDIPLEERVKIAIEHSELHEKMLPEYPFFAMRKNLGWYVKGFEGAKEVRVKLMLSNSSDEVREILKEI
jgi:tRNA-dihydrouridine synthase